MERKIRFVIVELLNIKDKEQILKAVKGEKNILPTEKDR